MSVLFVSLFAVLYTEACAQLLIKRFCLFVHSLTVGCLVIKIEHVEFFEQQQRLRPDKLCHVQCG
ncbi:hypothetical protein CDS [Salmonella enterica subsp. enterica serovar Derby]|nr:hypothetical protein CDS [Salmonella enterica subsp. enterica serovar Derby]